MLRKGTKVIAGGGLIILSLLSCSKSAKQGPQMGQQGPQAYEYIVAEYSSAQTIKQYPANLEGKQDVEIRPKIDGFIDRLFVNEGQHVSRGQALFSIRNPQYEQAVRVAAAAVKSAQADVATSQMNVTKTKPLVDKGIISKFQLEAAVLDLRSKEASLAQARANLVNAQVNEGYTLITSPSAGYVGELPLRIGSYVSSTSADPLTVVSDISTIFAYYSINEKDQLSFLEHSEGATISEKLKNSPNVSLVLSNGQKYSSQGVLKSMSGLVDPNTGAFRMRADFPNPNGILRSGYSATIQMPSFLDNVIVIPQSITSDVQGKILVFIVGKDDKLVSKEIQVTPLPGGQTYAVTSGLKAGDKIIVNGIGQLKDGMKVIPKPTTMQSLILKPAADDRD